MSLPYYKRFPRDYLEGCVGMPFELRAGYGMILDLIYMKDGRMPLDKPWIAGHLGCSVRMVSKIIDGLVEAGKLVVSDNHVTNKRADKVIEETRKYRDKQAEIASLPRKNNDLPQPKSSQSESYTERKNPLTPKGEREGEGLVERQFEAFWAAYPKKRAKADARKAFLKALKRATVQDIAKGLKRDKVSADWVKSDGQFIPYPASWLNAARWEDENVIPFHGAFVEAPAHDNVDPWPARIREWQRSGDWKSGDWGPPPDSPKTEVAARYLKDCLHSAPRLYDIAP
jgi:uncharacterized protein YdaU (DUF1376 family)